jgi:hypothetical protein
MVFILVLLIGYGDTILNSKIVTPFGYGVSGVRGVFPIGCSKKKPGLLRRPAEGGKEG